MSYKIEYDGDFTAELGRLLQSVERQVNGFAVHVQTSSKGDTLMSVGSTHPGCSDPSSDSVKGGHHILFTVAAIAIVAGAVAGYVAGAIAAKRELSVKGGHH